MAVVNYSNLDAFVFVVVVFFFKADSCVKDQNKTSRGHMEL